MADIPRVTADSFRGIFTNVTPNSIPAGGAQSQQNMRSQILGQLDVRGGLRAVTCAASTTASTQNVVSMYQYPTPGGASLVYELADGSIRIMRIPRV